MNPKYRTDLNNYFVYENGIYRMSKNDGSSIKKNEFFQTEMQNKNDYNLNKCAGLSLLEIKKNHVGIIYGVNIGNLAIYSSRCCEAVFVIEKNIENVKSLKERMEVDIIKNIFLINSNIDEFLLKDYFDFAIINGSLSKVSKKPIATGQFKFLKKVRISLRENGKVFFAEKNALSPKNIISEKLFFRSKKHFHSHSGYKNLLEEAGFRKIDSYVSFPDHNFPQKIIPFNKADNSLSFPINNKYVQKTFFKKVIRRLIIIFNIFIFIKLRLLKFSPSFIYIVSPKK